MKVRRNDVQIEIVASDGSRLVSQSVEALLLFQILQELVKFTGRPTKRELDGAKSPRKSKAGRKSPRK